MAKRGRKPKSLREKELHGTHRKDRDPGPDEPTIFLMGSPEKPSWLTGEASKLWDKMAPGLVHGVGLTPLDGGIFSTYCQMLSELQEVNEQIEELDSMFVTISQGNRKIHPLYDARSKILSCCIKLRAELRLDKIPQKQPCDPFQKILSRMVKRPEGGETAPKPKTGKFRLCPDCETPLKPRQRYCPDCARKRRRKSSKESQSGRRAKE